MLFPMTSLHFAGNTAGGVVLGSERS